MKPVLALVLAACGARHSPPAGLPPVVPRIVSASDGTHIAYDVRGEGKTALVFIHCFACDRSFWRNQLDVFATSYRVFSIDLAGHGRSGVERRRWTILGLAGDVEAVVEAVDLRRTILVGHSMGGPVALEAARRLGRRVRGVVCVDTLHDAAVRPREEDLRPVRDRLAADFNGAMASLLRSVVPPDTDPELIRWILERASRVDRTAALALFSDLVRLDVEALLRRVKVPIRCINAARPLTNIAGNRRLADFDATIMEGVGHFPMLERPDGFNDRLREVLAGFR